MGGREGGGQVKLWSLVVMLDKSSNEVAGSGAGVL